MNPNTHMRRSRQLLPREESLDILRSATNGVLALCGHEDYPYAVPISFAFDGEAIYIHSAVAGHKIDILKTNPKVSLCVVGQDNIVPEEFTTYFKSVIVFGTAEILTDAQEMEYGLHMLADKYSPGIDSRDEIERCMKRVAVVRITIDALTGKESIELTRKRDNTHL